MEDIEFENIYKIDKVRLSQYYERIKNHDNGKSSIEHITHFLINQSIGSSFEDVFDTLKYFEDKIMESQGLLTKKVSSSAIKGIWQWDGLVGQWLFIDRDTFLKGGIA